MATTAPPRPVHLPTHSPEQPLHIPTSPRAELQFGADVVARPRDVVPAQEAMQESVLLALQIVTGGKKRLQHLVDFLREIDVYRSLPWFWPVIGHVIRVALEFSLRANF